MNNPDIPYQSFTNDSFAFYLFLNYSYIATCFRKISWAAFSVAYNVRVCNGFTCVMHRRTHSVINVRIRRMESTSSTENTCGGAQVTSGALTICFANIGVFLILRTGSSMSIDEISRRRFIDQRTIRNTADSPIKILTVESLLKFSRQLPGWWKKISFFRNNLTIRFMKS